MPQTALITGATAGIGEACASLFAEQKFNLILVARRENKLKQLAERLTKQFDIEVKIVVADVRLKSDVEKMNKLPENWKKIDVLVNNAGLSQGLDPIDKGDTDDWDTMIDTNVKGLLYVTRLVSPWLVARKCGHIINIGSIAGKETYANGNVYCATKHAVNSLNQAMRIDLLPYGIRVTAIHPGAVETEFSEVRFKGDRLRAEKVYEGFDPLHAIDIAETVWFAVNRPPHVNINEMTVMPTAQASTTHLLKT